jgi:hypothetical protein
VIAIPRTRGRLGERGAILVEFFLVALVLYFLFAAMLELGFLIFRSHVLESAARTAARELALVPLAAEAAFPDALADPVVKARIFDPDFLVVDLDQVADLDAHFAAAPILNRLLRPLMIFERCVESSPCNLVRYPGALLRDPGTSSGYGVRIPKLVAGGVEWLEPIEEIRDEKGVGPFSLVSPGDDRGLVALRRNLPVQAATLTGFRPSPPTPDDPLPPTVANPIRESEGPTGAAPPSGLALIPELDQGVGAYAGMYGLGVQLAFADRVRPFRRILSAQAVFRREVLL